MECGKLGSVTWSLSSLSLGLTSSCRKVLDGLKLAGMYVGETERSFKA